MKRYLSNTCSALALLALLSGCSSNSNEALTEANTNTDSAVTSEESASTGPTKPVYDHSLEASAEEDYELDTQGDVVTLLSYTGSGNHAMIPEGVTHVYNHAFSQNETIVAVDFSSSITHVGNSSFSLCTELKELDLGNVVEIGTYSFAGCWSLEYLDIPSSVASIETYGFFDCPALETVVMAEGIEVIDAEAFANCPALSFVQLPASLSLIDDTAFDNASESLVFSVKEGSYAHTWAEGLGFSVSFA